MHRALACAHHSLAPTRQLLEFSVRDFPHTGLHFVGRNPLSTSPEHFRVFRESRSLDSLFNDHLAQQRVERPDATSDTPASMAMSIRFTPAGIGSPASQSVMQAVCPILLIIAQFAVQQSRPLHGSPRLGHYLDFDARIRIGNDLLLGGQLVQAHPVRD